ncbi:MAG: putative metal-dependent rane protease [Candidatus Eremiobacteraeota bacterium]|nr:putative metal-dependent rane protease [Candidatus Eremiobacteraeota bacterium]
MVKNSTSARSPLSPTLWPRSAFFWLRSVLLFAALVGVVIVATLVFIGVAVALYGKGAIVHMSPAIALAAQAVVYAPLLLLLLLVLPLIAERSLRDLGLRAPTAGDVAWGVGGALLMILVIEALSAVEVNVFHVKVSEQAVDLLKATHGNVIYVFAAFACVLAPFVEELVFRGFLLNAFLRYTPPPLAILLSALCFGAAHFSPSAFVPLAGGGVVLGFVYYRTGSLTASMIAHAGFNLFSIVGLVAFKFT